MKNYSVILALTLFSLHSQARVDLDKCGSEVGQKVFSCYERGTHLDLGREVANTINDICGNCYAKGANCGERDYAKVFGQYFGEFQKHFKGKCTGNKEYLRSQGVTEINETAPDAQCRYVGEIAIETFDTVKLEKEGLDTLNCKKGTKIHKCNAQMICNNNTAEITANEPYTIYCYANNKQCPNNPMDCYTDDAFETEKQRLEEGGYNVIRSNRETKTVE